jgi:hypothetical protein
MLGNTVKAIVTGILIIAATAPACRGQGEASVFVVYGTMYEEDGITPVEEAYQITVTNRANGTADSVDLGSGDGIGNYSIVWIDYSGGYVVQLGDSILVAAENPDETWYVMGVVSEDDMVNNNMRINISKGMIETKPVTWGAIKTLLLM